METTIYTLVMHVTTHPQCEKGNMSYKVILTEATVRTAYALQCYGHGAQNSDR